MYHGKSGYSTFSAAQVLWDDERIDAGTLALPDFAPRHCIPCGAMPIHTSKRHSLTRAKTLSVSRFERSGVLHVFRSPTPLPSWPAITASESMAVVIFLLFNVEGGKGRRLFIVRLCAGTSLPQCSWPEGLRDLSKGVGLRAEWQQLRQCIRLGLPDSLGFGHHDYYRAQHVASISTSG